MSAFCAVDAVTLNAILRTTSAGSRLAERAAVNGLETDEPSHE